MSESPRSRAETLAAGLYAHQVEGIAFLLGRQRAILADDMGLGKTRQSILAMAEARPGGPYLVVCPAAVKSNWEREIQLVLPAPEIAVIGPAPAPEAGFHGWAVVNYDILARHALSDLPWTGLVFDEAHYLKNFRSQRHRLAGELVQSAGPDTVVHLLTGTPLTSRPRDLFPLLQLARHALGRSFVSFARRYCEGYKGDYGWVADGASNIEELTIQLHGIMLRRTKGEVLDLPPKVRSWLEVEVSSRVARRMSQAVTEMLRSVSRSASHRIEGESEAQRRRRQGRVMGQLTRARRSLASAKVVGTLPFVENAVEQGEKVLVFSCFLPPVTILKKRFGEQAVAITGEVPAGRRQELADRFQEDESVRVLVAQIAAGGVGLNLTAARQVVFNDLDWVPVNHWQAEDRAYRIGQQETVNVTYLVAAGTVDEFVRTVLETKSRLIDQLIEGGALPPDLQRDVRRRARPVDDGVACGQLRGLRRASGVLGGELEFVQADQAVEHLPRAEVGQPLGERRARLVGADRGGTPGEDGTRVEPRVDPHDADPGGGVARHDRPLHRRRAAPARQERGVHVEAAAGRRVQHRRRQDEPVGRDDEDIESPDAREFGADALGRVYREAVCLGEPPRRAGGQPPPAPGGTVRLGEHGGHPVRRLVQRAQDADREVGSAGEPQVEGCGQALAASSRRCFASFLRIRPRLRLDR